MMKVEIWSDISCPWCYIGRRRFETALAQFNQRDQVEVVWRSFQLDPGAPKEDPRGVNDMLMQKYGQSRAKVEAMQAQVTGLASEEGLDFHMERVRLANTFDAHRLIHFAAERGLQGEMKEILQKAYFTHGELVSEHAALARLAGEAGLDEQEARTVLADPNAFAASVRADLHRARALGINGVPFFVIDNKYGISGAQPAEIFLQALEQAWVEAQPV